MERRGSSRSRVGAAFCRRALPLFALVVLGACETPEPALVRGDRLWADSNYADALAEYRLALQQSGGSDDALLRVAHAYARTGDLDRAREHYDRLLSRAPEYRDQAVHDYLSLARRSKARGDRFGTAEGVEAALELRSELPVEEFARDLARYYADMGDWQRAISFYERALRRASGVEATTLLYDLGVAHEARGDCRAAMGYFDAYRARVRRGDTVSDARWRTGNCAFQLARTSREAGDPMEALRLYARVLELRVPENVQDVAWFERGEILFALGRFDEALDSYRKVMELNPGRRGLLVERAQERIDQIRFGS